MQFSKFNNISSSVPMWLLLSESKTDSVAHFIFIAALKLKIPWKIIGVYSSLTLISNHSPHSLIHFIRFVISQFDVYYGQQRRL